MIQQQAENNWLNFFCIVCILVPWASSGAEHEDQEALGKQDLKS